MKAAHFFQLDTQTLFHVIQSLNRNPRADKDLGLHEFIFGAERINSARVSHVKNAMKRGAYKINLWYIARLSYFIWLLETEDFSFVSFVVMI